MAFPFDMISGGRGGMQSLLTCGRVDPGEGGFVSGRSTSTVNVVRGDGGKGERKKESEALGVHTGTFL